MLPSLARNLPLVEPVNRQQPERVDAASVDVLEEVGVVFCDEIARADLRGTGADVRGGRVPLDPAVNEALLDCIARREREIPATDALNTEL